MRPLPAGVPSPGAVGGILALRGSTVPLSPHEALDAQTLRNRGVGGPAGHHRNHHGGARRRGRRLLIRLPPAPHRAAARGGVGRSRPRQCHGLPGRDPGVRRQQEAADGPGVGRRPCTGRADRVGPRRLRQGPRRRRRVPLPDVGRQHVPDPDGGGLAVGGGRHHDALRRGLRAPGLRRRRGDQGRSDGGFPPGGRHPCRPYGDRADRGAGRPEHAEADHARPSGRRHRHAHGDRPRGRRGQARALRRVPRGAVGRGRARGRRGLGERPRRPVRPRHRHPVRVRGRVPVVRGRPGRHHGDVHPEGRGRRGRLGVRTARPISWP